MAGSKPRLRLSLARRASTRYSRAMTITVRPVASKADTKAFIELAYRLNLSDPNWVPPLKDEIRGLITPGKNPWFEHAEAAFFLAFRAGSDQPVVGVAGHDRGGEDQPSAGKEDVDVARVD